MRVFLQLFQLFFVINLGIQNAISLMVHVNHSLSSLSFPLFFHRHFQSWGRGTGELKPPTSRTLVPLYLLVSASLRFSAKYCVILPQFSHFPPPWESRFSPPLLSPPADLPPPFLQGSCSPVPLTRLRSSIFFAFSA